jgi:hypothetical protein
MKSFVPFAVFALLVAACAARSEVQAEELLPPDVVHRVEVDLPRVFQSPSSGIEGEIVLHSLIEVVTRLGAEGVMCRRALEEASEHAHKSGDKELGKRLLEASIHVPLKREPFVTEVESFSIVTLRSDATEIRRRFGAIMDEVVTRLEALSEQRIADDLKVFSSKSYVLRRVNVADHCLEGYLVMNTIAENKTGQEKSDFLAVGNRLKKAGHMLRCAWLIERACLSYAGVAEARADACLLSELYCRVVAGHPYSPCEIQAAERKRMATCSRLAILAPQWVEVLAEPFSKWSAAKAQFCGGSSDLDARACVATLISLKPILEEHMGKTWVDDVYNSPRRRTQLWLLFARTLRCSADQFYGEEEVLPTEEFDSVLAERSEWLNETEVALEYHLRRKLPVCDPCLKGERVVLNLHGIRHSPEAIHNCCGN